MATLSWILPVAFAVAVVLGLRAALRQARRQALRGMADSLGPVTRRLPELGHPVTLRGLLVGLPGVTLLAADGTVCHPVCIRALGQTLLLAGPVQLLEPRALVSGEDIVVRGLLGLDLGAVSASGRLPPPCIVPLDRIIAVAPLAPQADRRRAPVVLQLVAAVVVAVGLRGLWREQPARSAVGPPDLRSSAAPADWHDVVAGIRAHGGCPVRELVAHGQWLAADREASRCGTAEDRLLVARLHGQGMTPAEHPDPSLGHEPAGCPLLAATPTWLLPLVLGREACLVRAIAELELMPAERRSLVTRWASERAVPAGVLALDVVAMCRYTLEQHQVTLHGGQPELASDWARRAFELCPLATGGQNE